MKLRERIAGVLAKLRKSRGAPWIPIIVAGPLVSGGCSLMLIGFIAGWYHFAAVGGTLVSVGMVIIVKSYGIVVK